LIPHTSNPKLAREREREKCLVSSGRVGWNRSDRIEIEEQGGRKEGVELKKMGTMRRVVKEKRFWVASFLLVWAAALQVSVSPTPIPSMVARGGCSLSLRLTHSDRSVDGWIELNGRGT
jgi:hypothetical protein